MGILDVVFAFINLCFAVAIFFLTIAFITGAPFVPSTSKVSKKMIEMAGIHSGMTVYDLGSGDGRLLFLAAEKGATAIGYEINPILVFYTYIRKIVSPHHARIHVYWKNFWSADIECADVIFVYLLPWKMESLAAFIQRSCKPKTRIVSNSFIFPGWKILSKNTELHVYAFTVS